jgi:hypothetical protein
MCLIKNVCASRFSGELVIRSRSRSQSNTSTLGEDGFLDQYPKSRLSEFVGSHCLDYTSVFLVGVVRKAKAEEGIETHGRIGETTAIDRARESRFEEELQGWEECVHRPVDDF